MYFFCFTQFSNEYEYYSELCGIFINLFFTVQVALLAKEILTIQELIYLSTFI